MSKDPLNPDLNEIAYYAQEKSGKTMYDFLVMLGGMTKEEEVDYMHRYEMEMIREAQKRLTRDEQ